MSRNHSLKAFTSSANTMRIDSPVSIGGAPPRPAPSQHKHMMLRGAATVCAIVAIPLFAASIAYTDKHYMNLLGGGDWTDGLALAPPLIALLLNPILVFRTLRSPSTSATLILRIAGDLVIWGLAIPALIYAVAGGIFWSFSPAIPDSNGVIHCGGVFFWNALAPECAPVALLISRLQISGCVFLGLLAIMHLVLCVVGLVQVAKRRVKEEKEPQSGFEMQFGKEGESFA